MSCPSFIADKTEKLWISDEVPFGEVKAESTQTMHLFMPANSRFHTQIAPSTQVVRESREVVEFSY